MWSAVWAGRIEQTGQPRTNKVALSGRVFFKELRKLGEIVKVFQITEELDKNQRQPVSWNDGLKSIQYNQNMTNV